jgi:hypothetical protein
MRRSIIITIAAGLIAAFPSFLSAADPWDAYSQLRARYYFFDDQEVEQVSCRVVVPTLDPAKLREQLKDLGDRVKIDENINNFKVIYSKKDGVKFVVPHFELTLLSTEGAKDPKGLEGGLEKINHGILAQIKGTMQTVDGVLDDFIFPAKGSLENLEVTTANGITTVKHAKNGESFTKTYSGKTGKVVAKTQSYDLESNEEFTDLKGKLAPSKSVTIMHLGGTVIETTTVLKYRDLGKIFFPSAIEQHVRQSDAGQKQEADVKTLLEDCEVK